MAERRMFAKTIIDSDAFLDMPLSTQALYFHLSMRADDEGFINNPRKISRMIGASLDDMKVLISKNFIIPFDSGVVVIKHWKIHNYIRGDRLKQTVYQEEASMIEEKDNGAYTLADPTFSTIDSHSYNDDETVMTAKCQPNDVQASDKCQSSDSQVTLKCPHRLGKSSLVESNIVKEKEYISTPKPVKHKYGDHSNVLLTDDEYQKLIDRFPDDYIDRIEELSEGLALYGYKYKSHYLAILKWAEKDRKKHKETTKRSSSTDGDNIFLSIARDEGMI